MANESKRNSVAVDRLKSIFESDAMTTKPPIKPPVKPSYLRNAAQNGNIPSISDKGPGKDSEGTDMNSNSVPGKSRNSQVNIPAAFRSQSVDDKATKPKPPPPPTRKPVNKDGDDKPTPSWKKSNETQKPDPPWKQKLNENLAEKLGARQSNLNDNSSSDEPKKPDPPWKKNLHRNENGSQGESNTSGAKSDKPIPPWKQAILDRQKKDQDEKKDEKKDIPVAPPWKAKNEEADDKPTPPWKVPKKTNDDNVPVNKTDKPIPPWKQKASEKSDPKPPPPPQTAKPKSDVPNIAPATNKAELENIFKNLKRTPSKDGEPVLLRGPKGGDSLKRKMSRKSYTRVSDEKKFILIDVDDVDMDSTPPPKPARLVSFTELEEIIADYKAQLDGIKSPTSSSVVHDEEEVIEEDIYEPIPADEEEAVEEAKEEPAQLRNRGSKKKKSFRMPSLIPTMDSDEEDDEMYQDTANAPALPVAPPPTDTMAPPPVVGRPPPRSPVPNSPLPPRPPPKASLTEPDSEPQEEYADCEVVEDEEGSFTQDDVYEPLDDIQEEVERLEEEKRKEEMKKKETERKKKEEEDKKEAIRKEKQRKEEEKRKKKERDKLEKEQKTIIKKLELKPIDLDKSQGEGIIKRDDKVAKFGLEVKTGERVVIIKINNCAPGKWVCKNPETGLVGYVECDNVEIDNNLIKTVMVGGGFPNPSDLPPPPQELLDDGEEYDDFSAMEEPQEEYDDIQNTLPEPIQDDIYEPV